MATTKKAKPAKAKAKAKAKPKAAPAPKIGDVVIARKDAEPAPKIAPGVSVWIIDGDTLHLTPADMYDRGWIRRKG